MKDIAQSQEQLSSLDTTLAVDTPEHVTIEYPLAGLGSRFAALLLDSIFVVLLLVAVPLLLAAVFVWALNLNVAVPPALFVALLVIWIFVVLWGYFIYFEAFRDGQTPGKKALGIRVVMEGGTPLNFEAAATRNLIRFLDVQPWPSCLIGGFVMWISAKGQRLGDLAAGTVVVREQPIRFPKLQDIENTHGEPLLNQAAFTALESFVDRRRAFDFSTRRKLALKLSRKLPPSIKQGEGPDPSDFLVKLHAEESARRHSARLASKYGTPAAAALLRNKRPRWEAFRNRVKGLRGNDLKKMSGAQVGQFAAEYRELAADLARARTYGSSAGTLYALERLAGAAHNIFYRPSSRSIMRVFTWARHGFPASVRRLWRPIVLAGVLFYGPALVTYFLLTNNPELEPMLLSSDMIIRAEKATEQGGDYRDTWEGVWLGSEALSAQLMTNNIQVAFLAFAGGTLLGLGSVLLLIFNGLSIGAALAAFQNRGVLDNIGLFVLPHGVIELTAICIAGGAGMWMGSGLVLPGREKRWNAFKLRAREAVSLIGGVALMLVVAGLIEGFISPSRLPASVKLLAAGVAALGLVLYLAGGRRPANAEAEPGDDEAAAPGDEPKEQAAGA